MADLELSNCGSFIWRIPVAAAKTRSPSSAVCEGSSARAIPSCAATAMRCACALVWTTRQHRWRRWRWSWPLPSACGAGGPLAGSGGRVQGRRIHSQSRTARPRCPVSPAVAEPECVDRHQRADRVFPTAGHKRQSRGRPSAPRSSLRSQPLRCPEESPPSRLPVPPAPTPDKGCRANPSPPFNRSNRIAPGTMGTRTGPTAKPRPIARRPAMMPDPASRPKAEPPDRNRASTRSTIRSGARRSVSRVPGAPPITCTAATKGWSAVTTVTPERKPSSCALPRRRPATSVIRLRGPGAWVLSFGAVRHGR